MPAYSSAAWPGDLCQCDGRCPEAQQSTATVHITHSVVQSSIGPPSSGSQATNYNPRFGSFTSFNLVLDGPRNISHICIICISCNCPRAHISILSLRDGRHERRFFTLQNIQLMNKFITRRILINTCSSSLASWQIVRFILCILFPVEITTWQTVAHCPGCYETGNSGFKIHFQGVPSLHRPDWL